MDTAIVAPAQKVKELFNREDVKTKFQEILGKKAAGFMVSVINAVSNNENLSAADQSSVLFAAATAASLDLPIDPNLGFAYIVPYNQKQKDGTYKQMAQFQMGYKGFIQLAQRSGQFKSINAVPVYDGDTDESVFGRLTAIITPTPPDGKVVGYAAYFKLLNGFEKHHYMTVEELKKHGKRYSKSYAKGYGLWETDFESMAVKTVLKLLLSKFAPLSVEMQRAVISDQSVIKDWEGSDVEFVDNERVILNPEEVAAAEERKRFKDFIESAKTVKKLREAEYYCMQLEEGNELKVLYESKLSTLNNGNSGKK